MQKLRSHLFIFAFISFTLGDRSKKSIAMIYVKECSACVSSTFQSLIIMGNT